ncbi:hypothetical protein POPTR_008G216423v4 [Populus trichocarpa]|nr:hypothetical protein POPTR_008G216423v4 [Populus trichocarpa]
MGNGSGGKGGSGGTGGGKGDSPARDEGTPAIGSSPGTRSVGGGDTNTVPGPVLRGSDHVRRNSGSVSVARDASSMLLQIPITFCIFFVLMY